MAEWEWSTVVEATELAVDVDGQRRMGQTIAPCSSTAAQKMQRDGGGRMGDNEQFRVLVTGSI